MISHEELTTYFHYSPESGIFTRIKSVRGSRVGVVGSNNNGYLTIPFRRQSYMAHRLAWFYVHAEWPVNFIDHINGVRSDNSISNLREATNSENHQNLKKPRKDNKSGYLGVSKRNDRNKWKASVKHNGKVIHVGDFDTAEEAYEAYLGKKREIHTHCTL